MNRCKFGGAVLVLLIILSFAAGRWMTEHHTRTEALIDRVCRAVQAEDWDRAGELAAQAREHWLSGTFPGRVLTDHASMDRVDDLLALLEAAVARRDRTACTDLGIRLTQALRALAEEQKLSPGNLL